MIIFNDVVAPVIAMLFTSRRCFVDLLTGIPSKSSLYAVPFCQSLDVNAEFCANIGLKIVQIDILPPFIYNNVCREKMFEFYVPIFVITYGFLFLISVLSYGILVERTNPRDSTLHVVLAKTGSIFWPFEIPSRPFNYIYNPERVMTNQNVYTGLILTLGIVSPPLLVALVVALVADFAIQRTLIMRYVSLCSNAENLSSFNISCQNASRCPIDFLWTVVVLSYLFQIFFLLDMAADSVSEMWELSLIPILYILFSLGLKICFQICKRSIAYKTKQMFSHDSMDDTAMSSHLEVKNPVFQPAHCQPNGAIRVPAFPPSLANFEQSTKSDDNTL
jgi:hypothetical protein